MINLLFTDYIISNYEELREFKNGLAAVQNENGLWGYIDKTGKEVIPCQYKEAQDFSEGLAAVTNKDGLWGYIDKSDKVVIDFQYKMAMPFLEGLAPVKDIYNYWGYIDENGKEKIPFKYQEAYQFFNGLGIVKVGDKYKFVDEKNEKFGGYYWLEHFKEDYTIVQMGNSICSIDREFNIIKREDNWKSIGEIRDGLCRFKTNTDYWGFVDSQLNLKIPNQFYQARDFSDGVAIISYSPDTIGFTTKDGKTTVFSKKDKYLDIKDFHEGLAQVQNIDGLWGYIDKKGKEVIPCHYKNTGYFSEGLAVVEELDGSIYYINKKGTKKIKLGVTYYSALELEDKCIVIKSDTMKSLNMKKLNILNEVKKELIDNINVQIDEASYDIYDEIKATNKTKIIK